MTKHVLFFGITGFIGGSVFTTFKSAHPEFTYTALVRNEAHAGPVRDAGANPVIGSLTDLDLVARLVEDADVVINSAGSGDLEFYKAVIAALKKRKESGKGTGVLIHTSGTSMFLDGTKEGKLVEGGKVWTDASVDDIKSIPKAMSYGQADHLILETSARGDINSYTIAAAAVHGRGTGPVSKVSLLHKMIGNIYISVGQAFIVGEGTNIYGAIHISDLADLYLRALNYSLTNDPPKNTSYERYYFGTHEVITWGKIAEAYGKELHHFGKIESPEVGKKAFEDLSFLGPLAGVLAGNVNTKPQRGAALGWAPNGPSLADTLRGDLKELYSQ